MRTDDLRAIRANARKIVQEAAKIKDQDMRREIGLGAVVIVNLCNRAIAASGEPDPLRKYFEGKGLFVPWDEAEPPAGVVILFPVKDDDQDEGGR